MELISQFSSARFSSTLTDENIKRLEKLFLKHVGTGKEIRKEDFSKIIQTKNQFFTDRMFDIFDKDTSGSISLDEFLFAMHEFAGTDDKIRFLFKVYDEDGNGVIQFDELRKVMRACMEENGMQFSDAQIYALTRILFEDADVEKRGALTYEALKAQLEKHSGLSENLSISIERWLVPPKAESDGRNFITRMYGLIPHQCSFRYIGSNIVYLAWLLIFILTNIVLFVSKTMTYRENYPDRTIYNVLAKGAGQCLNFNSTFIVIVMLRQCLTLLRARRASIFLPIDEHIFFHKLSGWLIFLFGLFHTVMHLINIEVGMLEKVSDDCLANETCPLKSPNSTYLNILFDPSATPDTGLIPGFAFNTGVVLIIILITIVICSFPFVRRGGCFEIFYWTHLLYFAFWVLLIIHAPNFWRWFIAPGVIFLIEKATRYYRTRRRGKTFVTSGILLPSKVTHLVIRRPPNFEFHPGDYVYVKIPRIAKYEWHPFTISSAPEQEDELWLHIRAVGHWTDSLYEHYEKKQGKLNSVSIGHANAGSDWRRFRMSSFRDKNKLKCKPQEAIQEEMEDAGIMNDKSRKIKVDLKLSELRERLPTAGDSHSKVNPPSSFSLEKESAIEVFTSVDSINETDGTMKNKKVPVILNEPKLTSAKSLPNVHERMLKREIKLKSLSVNKVDMDNKIPANGKSHANAPNLESTRTIQKAPISIRYMKNNPTGIAVKTTSNEGQRYELLQTECADRVAEEGRMTANDREGTGFDDDLKVTSPEELSMERQLIYLDGPYGAPSSHIFRAEHAVLIAASIGVTPFASILRSIMHYYRASSRICCPKCNFTWCGEDWPRSILNLKKVDFLWINRDQTSFEWFIQLLSQLEIEQAEHGGAMERFLEMHMYITSALQRTDMKAVGLQLALDLLHEKEKRDLITGLKTRTNAGRPNWDEVFKQLAAQRKGQVTVFYCGPHGLSRKLKVKCEQFGFYFRKELF